MCNESLRWPHNRYAANWNFRPCFEIINQTTASGVWMSGDAVIDRASLLLVIWRNINILREYVRDCSLLLYATKCCLMSFCGLIRFRPRLTETTEIVFARARRRFYCIRRYFLFYVFFRQVSYTHLSTFKHVSNNYVRTPYL